jgi:predicted TIM-barrel fold metal-dependent hydrolase
MDDRMDDIADDKVIIVSSDSHAGVPKELWSEYLDARYHELIPLLRADNEIYPTAIYVLSSRRSTATLPELQEAHRSDYHGLHDAVLRLADMDREGIAAELVYHGDFRLGDMFHNATNRTYATDAWDAGARGWNRWAADNFGFAMDRFLVVGAIGSCADIDATIRELEWLSDHRFAGTYGPGYMRRPDTPPLFDAFWEPFWSVCEERDLAVVVHAGFGTEQGVVFPQLERIYNDVTRAAGTTDLDVLVQHADAVSQESVRFFHEFLSHGIPARRPMWQMMLGGVFDRHPRLKLVLTEIRLDWIPATLRHLDAVYEEHREALPARRRPSDYWATNCLAGASFIHQAEVAMRDEIGVETILFGRDFPHPEGTWPHTKEWLRLAFADVSDDETRLMLGENGIRFLGLDRARLGSIAKRIGPTLAELRGTGPDVRAELVESFDARGGFLREAEGDSRIAMVDELLREDLAAVGAGV